MAGNPNRGRNMKHALTAALFCAALMAAPQAQAFCGFYVAKADAKLFNKASKVVVAHDDDKTVVTMASDYEGDPKEFAVVIPVPSVITKEQVHITDNALVDHVDAYSAPRLVEYYDENPCRPMMMPMASMGIMHQKERVVAADAAQSALTLGVKIEEQYTVGEYDILILSAKESGGLETWLRESGYKIPEGASEVLGSYIKQDMKFFVAKVNLQEQEKLGFHYLRPIQMAYESRKFMLPIRLGTVNADGPQELFIFMLTRRGRVETTNYRTVEIPSGEDVPLFTKDEFGEFYKAMFNELVKKNDMRTVFLEYSWNMGWCDPCAADPIPADKLQELGAFWIGGDQPPVAQPMGMQMIPSRPAPGIRPNPNMIIHIPPYPSPYPPSYPVPNYRPQDVFITRLHLRYDREHFPEDLMFEETSNTGNFQGRYVLHHPFTGEASCPAGEQYLQGLPAQFDKQAENLARLTGWDMATIRRKMESGGQSFNPGEAGKPPKWYQRMWKQ
jgi:hypothetical protein